MNSSHMLSEFLRRAGQALLPVIVVAACGGGGDSNPDGGGVAEENAGFIQPTEKMLAYTEEVEDVWTPAGPADWSCLGDGAADVPVGDDLMVSGLVTDFEAGTIVPDAQVTAFHVADLGTSFADATSDIGGAYSLTIPAGSERIGFKVVADGTLDTYQLNNLFDAVSAVEHEINSVSQLTANALPAFIGVSRTPGLGVLAGSISDCQDRRVSNAIVAVSSASGSAAHVDGATTYYFSALATSLPVRHSQQKGTNTDGVFVVIEIEPGEPYYLQVWGYPDDASVGGALTLVAEIPVPVVGDSVVIASLDPLR